MGDVPRNNEKGMFDKIGDSISGMFSSAKDTVVDNRLVRDTGAAASAAAGSVVNSVNNFSVTDVRDSVYNTLSHNTSVLFLIVLLVVLAFIIGYIIYNIITDSVLYQTKIVIAGTEKPIFCNKLTTHRFSQKLENGNGNKRTYCFWLYIFNINAESGKYRHVAHITSDNENYKLVKGSSPYIILDKNSNKLHFRFAPKNENDSLKVNNINDQNIDKFMNSSSEQILTGFTIEYIPLQRWVHVAIVVNDIGGGSITTYVDSLLSETYDKNNSPKLNISKLNLDAEGTLVVGGDTIGTETHGFSGLLSKFTMFNYDLNKNDIYKLYKDGPVNTFMTSLGIGAYGLRSPIYKLEASSVETSQ